jgi:hypothetical protein
MIEISPSYALNKSNVNILDIQAFYTENQPKIEVATSDISGAITALAAAQEAERLRNQTENFYQLTNDNKILATEAATQAQLWAEGEEPGGPGTRSAKAWVESIPPIIGVPGSYMSISTDPDNRLTTGSDAGLYVPELTVDPLAYYIISKS